MVALWCSGMKKEVFGVITDIESRCRNTEARYTSTDNNRTPELIKQIIKTPRKTCKNISTVGL